MTAEYCVTNLFDDAARRFPNRTAVNFPGGVSLTYGELDALSDRLRYRLRRMGVTPGDRVGLRLHKSVDALAVLLGVLKVGAAYVPVDAESPVSRGSYILNDCAVKVVVTEARLEGALTAELSRIGASPSVMALDDTGSGVPLERMLSSLDKSDPAPLSTTHQPRAADVAYILYTSGSTGNPKGVVLSHGNAISFVNWCSETFEPTCNDVFSSHAPFHFDLSILDIFVSLKHGARLALIGEALGKDPLRLAAAIAAERITIWYSTPSILSFLANYGKLERHDCSALRIVLFAGEVFPIPQFRALHALWPAPRYFNLYGPTETNVCTYYEVPPDDSWQRAPTFPIGRMCWPNRGIVVDEHGQLVAAGQEGELLVNGPNVMQGYWNLPEQSANAFRVDPDGTRWYRTGDIVVENEGGVYCYLGRRDRMVKRRGYRVELGEIEAGLVRHPDVREAAVVAVPDPESGVRIAAFVSCHTARSVSMIELKTIAAKSLPPYMVPDAFVVVEALPRTSTNKVDFQQLKATLSVTA